MLFNKPEIKLTTTTTTTYAERQARKLWISTLKVF